MVLKSLWDLTFSLAQTCPTLSIQSNIFHCLRTSQSQHGYWWVPDHILLKAPQYTLQRRCHWVRATGGESGSLGKLNILPQSIANQEGWRSREMRFRNRIKLLGIQVQKTFSCIYMYQRNLQQPFEQVLWSFPGASFLRRFPITSLHSLFPSHVAPILPSPLAPIGLPVSSLFLRAQSLELMGELFAALENLLGLNIG